MRTVAENLSWPEGDSNWLISFSDLTLLLLSFVLLWYLSDKEREKNNQIPATAAAIPAGSIEKDTRNAVPYSKTVSSTAEWKVLQLEMEHYVDTLGLRHEVGVVSSHHGLTISLKDTFPFASGKADLLPDLLPVLRKVAAIAETHEDLSLEITGHTDDVPIATSEFPSNWELSAARASRVARSLAECGIDASRLVVQGYGSFRPLQLNTSETNRAANRRVEIRLFRAIASNG
ncbi:MAG: OmpA family protein [Deltaproteobacteria bacterium]|nr:OmpA family protein [Deltaproteobacteria bacterium]